MTPQEIDADLKRQADLIGVLFTQLTTVMARLETVLSMQRELLVKAGLDRDQIQKTCIEVYGRQLAIAKQESATFLESPLAPPPSEEPPSGDSSPHLN